MEKNFKKIANFIHNQEDLEDIKKFQFTSAFLICSIVDINIQDIKKFYLLFEDNLNLAQDEFNQIKNELKLERIEVDDKILYLKTALNSNMYQVMQFLKILNKFAILDGCTQKSYHQFELIRDTFLKEHY